MNTESLARNTLFSALSTASNILLVVLVIAAGRVLGDSDFGKFSLALAVASIFEIPTDLGLGTLTVRDVARDRGLASRYLRAILPWKLILSVAVMLALIPTALLLTSAGDTRLAIYIMGVAIVLRSFKGTAHAFFRAWERFDLVLLTTYSERILVVVVCGLVLLRTSALIPFALAFALIRVPDLIYSYYLLHRKIVPLGMDLSLPRMKEIQLAAMPFGSLNIVTVMYAYLGTVILGAMRASAEVGWYSAGYRIYEGFTMFPFILCAVLLPRLSHLWTIDKAGHARLAARGLKYVLILSLPIVVCGWLFAPWILGSVFGTEYLQGTLALRLLLAACIPLFANWMLNTILISADRQATVLKVSALGLAVSAAAHVVLVREYGASGAAAAALLAEVCVLTMFIRLIYREALGSMVFSIVWRPAVACGVGVAALNVLGLSTVNSAVIFAVVYLGMLMILRAFDLREWSAVKSVFALKSQPRS